jgi:hypothetical protein
MVPTRPLAARLGLQTLDARDVPSAVAHPHRFAVGSGAGQAGIVSVYDADTNALLTTVTPFGRDYTGGVRVATGDVTGDGVDDLVVADGTAGRVKAYDGATGAALADFAAFGPGVRGAFVAVGDVTGDGRADVVVGAGDGGSPEVRVYRGQAIATGKPAVSAVLRAYDAGFTGGVRVAVGDVTGDRIGDIVTAPGAGTAPVVKVFYPAAAWGDNGSAPRWGNRWFTAGGAGDTGGVFVTAGDLTGDGRAEVIVGRTVGGRATVSAYDLSGSKPRAVLNAWQFNASAAGGVTVAARDLDGDGRAELLVGGGEGTSQVRVLKATGGLGRSFVAFAPEYTGGVFVG